MKIKYTIILLLLFLLVGCSTKVNKISEVNEFEKLFESSVKYDLRDVIDCELGHIPGFMCMGDLETSQLVENILTLYKDKKQSIIIIGYGDEVFEVLDELAKKRYKNLYTFDGGYDTYVELKGEDFIPELGCGC